MRFRVLLIHGAAARLEDPTLVCYLQLYVGAPPEGARKVARRAREEDTRAQVLPAFAGFATKAARPCEVSTLRGGMVCVDFCVLAFEYVGIRNHIMTCTKKN